MSPTVEDVRTYINTSLDDPEIQGILSRQIPWARHTANKTCQDTDLAQDDTLPFLVAEAALQRTVALILKKYPNSSNAKPVVERRQGNKRVRYAVSQEDPSGDWFELASESLEVHCEGQQEDGSPQADVHMRDRWQDLNWNTTPT
jgi:hypothetical protein